MPGAYRCPGGKPGTSGPSGGDSVGVDPRLPDAVRQALRDQFPVTETELVVYPTNFACPSAVLRDPKTGTFPEGVPARLFFGQAALATSSDVRGQALVDAKVPASQARAIGFAFAQNNESGVDTLTVTASDWWYDV